MLEGFRLLNGQEDGAIFRVGIALRQNAQRRDEQRTLRTVSLLAEARAFASSIETCN